MKLDLYYANLEFFQLSCGNTAEVKNSFISFYMVFLQQQQILS